jgi:hypothetical protein
MYKKYFGLKNKAWLAKAGYYKPLPPEPKIDISKNIEEFLAAGGTITKLPPHEGKAKPYATKKEMRKRTEMGWDGKGVSGGAGRSAPKNEKVFICGGFPPQIKTFSLALENKALADRIEELERRKG